MFAGNLRLADATNVRPPCRLNPLMLRRPHGGRLEACGVLATRQTRSPPRFRAEFENHRERSAGPPSLGSRMPAARRSIRGSSGFGVLHGLRGRVPSSIAQIRADSVITFRWLRGVNPRPGPSAGEQASGGGGPQWRKAIVKSPTSSPSAAAFAETGRDRASGQDATAGPLPTHQP